MLRKFKAGKIDEALRRALPIGGPLGRGSVVANNARLPFHSLIYSLGKFLGAPLGHSSMWLVGTQSQHLLSLEYRKAAAQAAERGDHRRAAYIFVKLLHDYRAAANVLQQGGLFHDAAILYLKLVGDDLAAAAAFEAGGEFDRALLIYLEKGQHLQAAELMRRAGDEDRAIEYFTRAAEDSFRRDKCYLVAGTLMLNKAGRTDLARKYFEQGWARRTANTDLACGSALAALFAAESAGSEFQALLVEAEEVFQPGLAIYLQAPAFFNQLAEQAGAPGLAGIRDDVRDRCMLNLARLLRHRASHESRPGTLAQEYFGSNRKWGTGVVSDADHAWRRECRARKSMHTHSRGNVQRFGFMNSEVLCCCLAPESGSLFLGFRNGAIACYETTTGNWISVAQPSEGELVVALATSNEGDVVVSLVISWGEANFGERRDGRSGQEDGLTDAPLGLASIANVLCSFQRSGPTGYVQRAKQLWDQGDSHLAPLLPQHQGGPLCILIEHGKRIIRLDAGSLVSWGAIELPEELHECDCMAILPALENSLPHPFLLTLHGSTLTLNSYVSLLKGMGGTSAGLQWAPHKRWLDGAGPLNTLLKYDQSCAIAGISEDGFVCYSSVELHVDRLHIRTSMLPGHHEGWLCACPIRPGRVAAIKSDSLQVLQTEGPMLSIVRDIHGEFADAVACFRIPAADELLIVYQKGELSRVSGVL